ncbi:hypothetical protein ACQP00_06230 [Dactylosporangium sp. CS-047395]|uniref:hypothetical protein n=1 Tax=Dactylosporangium sp. CS-047395 TaxID=3239936 RepID=UPI003D90C0F8
MPKYGGFRLSRENLEQLLPKLAQGGVPMRFNHDAHRPMDPQNVEAGIEALDDGEFALWVEFDVDEVVWREYEREVESVGAPGGFSIATTETFAARGTPPFGVKIFVEYGCFDEQSIGEAAASALPPEMPFELAWLYEFSAAESVRAVIELADATLLSIPGNILASYLYDFMKFLRGGFAAKSRTPSFELQVKRTPTELDTTVRIVTMSDEGLSNAMRELPEILRAEGAAASWSDTDGRWKEVAMPNQGSALPEHE